MKKTIFLFCLALSSGAMAQAQNPQALAVRSGNQAAATTSNAAAPKFSFTEKEDTHDFGLVPEGKPVSHVFTFKNTGKQPLIISNGSASCGCTTPKWPEAPVLPGKTGTVTVEFKTEGRPGPFNKTVYLSSNAPGQNGSDKYELYIKGEVSPKTSPSTR
jgi:hypothetical protein